VNKQPRTGDRVDLIASLRSAAPWQKLRQQQAGFMDERIHWDAGDLQIKRFVQRAATATIFCVDASGSAAMQRLAEAKGAVELLLADCYVRRDEVAVVAFRGTSAEILLPPTRSLLRAKRELGRLAGGGGTPLASGITAANELARAVSRRNFIPFIVVLTDGRANVTLDGQGDRPLALQQALDCARAVAAAGYRSLLLDTSPRGEPNAHQVALALGADYHLLPHANARIVNQQIRQSAAAT
jgi:magnesium chelatase subunit D